MSTHSDRSPESSRSAAAGTLLAHLGDRVRRERHRCGLSRSQLADRSGLSLRFLAQLEAGRANISLQRLHEVATALGVPLIHLLETQAPEPAVLPPTVQHLLTARTPDEMNEIADWLTERFVQQKQQRIALLGLRGAGKSSVGARLAQALHVPFFELDALIEEAADLSLQEIFELQGQEGFRDLERRTLVRFLGQHHAGVLATGGGIVTAPETFRLVQRSFVTVWLQARPEDHWNRVKRQGDQRPMHGHPAAMKELERLLATRQAAYAQADLTVDTATRPVGQVTKLLVAQLRSAAPDVWSA